MAAPYLIVAVMGDSNCMVGKYSTTTGGPDNAGSRIYQYKQDTSIAVANEPLDHGSNGGWTLPEIWIGSTVALCRDIRDGGLLPTGFDILIVPGAQSGTGYTEGWDVGETQHEAFITLCIAAMATHANNKMWFVVNHSGYNDGGITQTNYQNKLLAEQNDFASRVPTGLGVPWIVAGNPPDRLIAEPTTFNGMKAARENVAAYLANAKFVDPSGLHSDGQNGVHFSAASLRGGVDNGFYGGTVTNSLKDREYAALLTSRTRTLHSTWRIS